MRRVAARAKATYDASWATATGDQADYPRNRLLSAWAREWAGGGKKVLDVGCGDGAVCEMVSNLGYEVIGIDISESGLQKARQRVEGTFLRADVEERLPLGDAIVDLVFWGDNVEHLIAPMATLREIYRVLKPSGRLVVSCPNVGFWRSRLIYLVGGSMPRNEGHVNPPWSWEHIRFFTPRILRAFLEEGGFRVLCLQGATSRRIGLLARLWPSLFATTLLAEAAPVETAQRSRGRG